MIYYKKSNGTFAFQVWVRERETESEWERETETETNKYSLNRCTCTHIWVYACNQMYKRTNKKCASSYAGLSTLTTRRLKNSGFKRCFAGWEAACAACSAQTREPRLISRRWCAVELQLRLNVYAGELRRVELCTSVCARVQAPQIK